MTYKVYKYRDNHISEIIFIRHIYFYKYKYFFYKDYLKDTLTAYASEDQIINRFVNSEYTTYIGESETVQQFEQKYPEHLL